MNVAVLLGFIGLQIAIGLWASRRVRSEADFFVAGRRLGVPLVTMSLFATWFGAESCLGSSGAIYAEGLAGGRADPFGYAICLLLVGLFLAARLARGDYLTLGDLYRDRYGAGVERFAVLLLVPSSLLWGAAQIRALGQLVAHLADLPVSLSIVLCGGLVIAYAFLGGLWGDVVTDFVQGIVLSVGLLALLCAVAWQWPGDVELARALAPERLRFFPEGHRIWNQLDRLSVPILGSLVTQELVSRILGAKSPGVARASALWASGLYLLIGLVPAVLGLLGPALVPQLADPELLLPELAARFLSPVGGVLFSCALVAAILSTVDSVLLTNSALLSHNLLGPWLGLTRDKARLWLGRWVLVGAGAFAVVVAFNASSIYQLVETASSFGTAGVLVVTLAALFLEKPDARAALVALVLGMITTPLARFFDLAVPFLLSVASACLGFVAFQLKSQSSGRPRAPSTSPENSSRRDSRL